MGCGKSTIGKALSGEADLTYVYMDQRIEQSIGLTISEIFDRHTASYFRYLEAYYLRVLQAQVCSTGGGVPFYYDNMALMQRKGITVFVDTPWYVIRERLKEDRGDRPLASGQNLYDLYLRRYPIYQTASVRFYPRGVVQQDASDLLRLLSEFLNH